MSEHSFTSEKQRVLYHKEISKDGFHALQRVTIFCCSGCGLCVSICPFQAIAFNNVKKRPELQGHCRQCGFCYLACPRSFLPLSKIRQCYFGKGSGEEKERLGNFVDLFTARSLTEHIYQEGTPGGTTTALVYFLMEKGYVHAVLLTKGKHKNIAYCMHPEPYIACSPDEVLVSSHSKFEISPVLERLRELSSFKSAAFVGTPCHILAFRKLQILHEDKLLSSLMPKLADIAKALTANIKFAVSINCFLNHTSMDKILQFLAIEEKDIKKFNENVAKDLYGKAFKEGKDWRWFFKNNVVTVDGQEYDYDVLEVGRRVLPSGCLVCNNLITSKEADASIGFYGAENSENDIGWNSVVVLNHELKGIFDEMVKEKKLLRRPFVKGYGRIVRKYLEWLIHHGVRTRDVMGIEHYLSTGEWLYPRAMKKLRGTRRTYIFGLELLFLAQTLRQKFFYQGAIKKLKETRIYCTMVY